VTVLEAILEIALSNLLSPLVLFFLLGILAVMVNSDLKVPEALYSGYTMIILLTIGIKGGVELSHVSLSSMLPVIIVSLALSLVMAVLTFVLFRWVLRHSLEDAAAMAAHYGSVSAVTFAAGISFLDKFMIEYESYISIILAILEGPAIIAAILYYKYRAATGADFQLSHVLKEAFFGKSIFLLIGGLFIGMFADPVGIMKIKPLFGDLFYGLLSVFLLHMGMVSMQNLRKTERIRFISYLLAFILPIIGGTLGVWGGHEVGLTMGGSFMIGLLTASASYIAAPAAISQTIPKANPGMYLSFSLGLTLPFNLIAGIPYYYWLANILS
jgi:hypothetical protein